ncbi:MAG: rhodanese-like domain-containing protein [Nitrospirae bacterium]|nr:MAG: rhodanese-like domain-containing protein [Nitrospirota bacterium]
MKHVEAGAVLLDVRTPGEYASGHAAGAKLVPWLLGPGRPNLHFVEQVRKVVPPDRPVVVICRSGHRSAQAAAALRGAGYKEVYDVLGGSIAWSRAHLPWEVTPPVAQLTP